jgi:hypothetical protein
MRTVILPPLTIPLDAANASGTAGVARALAFVVE